MFNFFNTLSHEDLYQHTQISQVKLNEHETYITGKQLIVSQSSDASNKRHITLSYCSTWHAD